MIRVTARLATRLHVTPAASRPPESNPYADWTAHRFTADRTQSILVTNTAPLSSGVLDGAGITRDDRFVDRVLHHLSEFLSEDGFEPIFQRRVIASAAFDTALRLNEAPMSYLGHASPRTALATMDRAPEAA